MTHLHITSIWEAKKLLLRGWPTIAISLIDPKTDLAHHGDHHLIVEVDDTRNPGRVAPNATHLRRVLDITANLRSQDRLLVHCMMGLSRSPAMAIGILTGLGTPWRDAYARVAKLRPHMMPNEEFVALIDAHFALRGELVEHNHRFHLDQCTGEKLLAMPECPPV